MCSAGGALPLELTVFRNGNPELLPAGTVIRLDDQKAGEFDGAPVIFEQASPSQVMRVATTRRIRRQTPSRSTIS
jgi:hypothetical protein